MSERQTRSLFTWTVLMAVGFLAYILLTIPDNSEKTEAQNDAHTLSFIH